MQYLHVNVCFLLNTDKQKYACFFSSAKHITTKAQAQQSKALIILHCTKLQLSLTVNSDFREAVVWNISDDPRWFGIYMW